MPQEKEIGQKVKKRLTGESGWSLDEVELRRFCAGRE
jgi:hypothetical protein